jgi:hypothetical protein
VRRRALGELGRGAGARDAGVAAAAREKWDDDERRGDAGRREADHEGPEAPVAAFGKANAKAPRSANAKAPPSSRRRSLRLDRRHQSRRCRPPFE